MHGVILMLCVFAAPVSAILIVGGISVLCKAKDPMVRRRCRHMLAVGVAGIVSGIQSSYFASIPHNYQHVGVILLTAVLIACCVDRIIFAYFFQKEDQATSPTPG